MGSETTEAAMLAVFDATSGAWAAGDADAFATQYADDATVILPGIHLRGSAEIRAAMGEAFTGPLKGSRRLHAVLGVRSLGDDAATVITRSATAYPGEADPPAERWELATWVLIRRADGWFVKAYHSCPAPDDHQSSPSTGGGFVSGSI